MSGFITITGENFLLDLICRAQTAPETLYIALIAQNEPTKFTTGEELDEPTIDEYSRLAYPNASGNWSEREGEMSNTKRIETDFILKSGWPRIRHWGILDEPFGGNLLWAGTFDASFQLSVGDKYVIPVGTLTIRTAAYMSRVSVI